MKIIELKVGNSLQETIDRAPEGAVICLPEGIWEESIMIGKNLVIRGAGPEKTVIKGAEWDRSVIGIFNGFGKSLETEVILENITIVEAKPWHAGVDVYGRSVRAILRNLRVSNSKEFGVTVRNFARVEVINSTLSNNGSSGLYAGRGVQVNIENTLIEGNKGNGLLIADKSYVVLSNTTIRNNTGWGIAAIVRKCLYPSDEFTGTVLWKDRDNKIYNNGRGDICLPLR